MRLAALCVLLTLVASTAFATTPVQDGTVNVGEYTFQSGNWSMAWDDTFLYVGRTNISSTFVVHVDVDPLSTPVAGTNASGNKQSGGDMCCGGTNPYVASLPFRGDVKLVASSGFDQFLIRDGSGSWTAGAVGSFIRAVNGTTIELRLSWNAVPGTSSRPASFNWLAYDLYADGLSTSSTNMMPATNTAGATRLHHFFNVWDTTAAAIPTAFSDQQSTWIVQTTGDSGTGSLRQAITDANADSTSTRRFIAFDVTNGISTTATVPIVTRTMTIDGTTQGGFSTEPIVVVTGPGSNSGVNGIELGAGSTNSVVRGLVMQSFATAIVVSAASGQKIAGNWLGIDSTGMAATANYTGILITATVDVTIGGGTPADRNVISGNTAAGIWANGPTNLTVVNNYIGTNKLGAAAVPNASGIISQAANANVIGGETSGLGNVISGNSGAGIEISVAPVSLLTIKSNNIGVGADGTTAIGNGAQGIHGQNNLIVGTNTIANNGSTGVTGSVGPVVIRGNSIYSNSPAVLVENSPPLVSVTGAGVNGSTLTIQVSASSSSVTAPTQSMQLDLYGATGTHAFLATSPCYTGSSLSAQTWSPAGTFNTDPLKVMVTTFSDVNCTTYGDGTSNETTFTPQNYSATTTTTLSGLTGTLWTGSALRTLTATVSAPGGVIISSGTVAFTDNNVAIAGCTAVSVSNGSAVCAVTIGTAGQHSYVGTYSGSVVAAGSTSSPLVVTAETHTFTGTGLFTDTARWSQSTVPLEGEDAIINGACTVADSTPTMNTLTMSAGATVTIGNTGLWAQRVTGTGSATIDLGPSGGALLLFGNGVIFDDANVTLVPNAGEFFIAGQSVTLPALTYNNLRLYNTAVVTSIPGTAVINGTFLINPGGSINSSTGTLDLRGATGNFLASSSIVVPNLLVASGAAGLFTGIGTFTVTDTLTVNGTFGVGVGTVSGGTLTGSGTIRVLKGGSNPLQAQYAFTTRNLGNLTAEFTTQIGQAAQTIDPLTYGNVTINNTNGVTIASDVTVAGTLNLQAGVATLTTGSLYVTNSSTSAITRTSGRLVTSSTGLLVRALAAGSGSYLYPLGLASEALDVTLTPSGVTGAGNVGVRVATGNAGSGSGIDTARDVNLRWTIANQSASGGTCSALLAFGSNVDGGTTPSAFVVRAFNAAYSNVAASGASASSITGSGIAIATGQTAELFAGNQLADHLSITAGAAQTVATSFVTTATLQDVLNVTVGDASGTVTFSANSGNVQYDSNGNGTWGDNTKALSGGAITILTRGLAAETVTLTGSVSSINGSSSPVTISASSFGPPLLFAATAAGTSSVSLTWSPVAGATSYKIYRSTGGAPFGVLTSVASTSHTDSGLSANKTYLYRVSTASNATESATTTTDPATTVIFTDTSLSGAVVRAYHLTELRTAVNAMRIAAGLGATTFTDNTLSTGATIKRLHITELRTALDEARNLLAVPALNYGEAITAATTSTKASHVTELRAGTQ